MLVPILLSAVLRLSMNNKGVVMANPEIKEKKRNDNFFFEKIFPSYLFAFHAINMNLFSFL